ncbi:Fc receptor-like protein 5 [Astatotilapia calliptera]|uniref:Fc receptor-like protein 5 n=1 Tax=Astatotilapia calliptera TaxID=8154 RepID=UPI000E417BC9|nr:Fc receptor-like protein 5 [Astatotilapia calliptera]
MDRFSSVGLTLGPEVEFGPRNGEKVKATVTANTEIMPAGGSVTLTCDVNHFADLEYDWFRQTSKNSKKTAVAGESDRVLVTSEAGFYTCRGRVKDSDPVIIHETVPSKPTVTLQPSWTQIYSGETVTVRCEIQGGEGAQWTYEWRRGQSNILPTSNEYRIIRVTESDSGGYSCRGRRDYFFSEWSDIITLTVLSNKPTVTLQPSLTQIYSGETVTVRCEIQGGEGAQWTYEWRAAKLNTPPTSNEYRIIRATESDSGGYSCRGRRDYFFSEWSDTITLTVSYEPRPVLTVSPSWLSPGASVTLNCEVEHPSAGWSFYWYKAVPDLSEKSSSYELLPDGSGTAQDSYIIHGQTHTAGYVCRAGRGDPEYHTDHSRPKFVWSADVHSAASLTVSPDRVQHFTSDSVSLTCEGNFPEWRVRKFSEDGRLYSDCRRMTGSTCDINTSKSDTAVYWCESGSGEFSSAVNITVQNDGNGPILVSPVHPVTEGASVSLSCSLRTQQILSNVFFYHNDKLIENDPRGELKISAVSKSDEGFYKCQYSGRESAQSWMSVKGDSSSPVWLMVGLVCGVALIIILLLLLYRCRRTNSTANEQTLNQDGQQQPSSLLHAPSPPYPCYSGSIQASIFISATSI